MPGRPSTWTVSQRRELLVLILDHMEANRSISLRRACRVVGENKLIAIAQNFGRSPQQEAIERYALLRLGI